MNKANAEIRKRAKEKGVPLWELGARLGIRHSEQFSKKMRFEFSADEKERALRAIDEISSEHEIEYIMQERTAEETRQTHGDNLEHYFCPYCGEPYKARWEFCPICGKRIKWTEEEKG